MLLAVPFRAFTSVTRRLLEALNAVANRILRVWHVEPVDEASGARGPAELRVLIGTSREHGLLEAGSERLLTRVLELSDTPVYAVTLPLADADRLPLAGTAADVVRVASDGGRSRLVVVDASGVPAGLVHVREAVLSDPATPVADLLYDTVRLDPHTSVVDALARMRSERAQLALVIGARGERHRHHGDGGPHRARPRGVRGRDRPAAPLTARAQPRSARLSAAQRGCRAR